MSAASAIFTGMHALSALALWMLIAEYRRLCADRETLFRQLGDGGGPGRRRKQHLIVVSYLLSTLAMFAVSVSALRF